jgi:Transferrin receptor-like dimerisation domain
MIQKMNQFRDRAQRWLTRRDQLIVSHLEQRALNDQLMMLERVFLLPKGLPGRPDVRHALFSPAKFDLYGNKQ